jgi:hypothetical protein
MHNLGGFQQGGHHLKKKSSIQEVEEDFGHIDFWVFSVRPRPSFPAYFGRGLLAI